MDPDSNDAAVQTVAAAESAFMVDSYDESIAGITGMACIALAVEVRASRELADHHLVAMPCVEPVETLSGQMTVVDSSPALDANSFREDLGAHVGTVFGKLCALHWAVLEFREPDVPDCAYDRWPIEFGSSQDTIGRSGLVLHTMQQHLRLLDFCEQLGLVTESEFDDYSMDKIFMCGGCREDAKGLRAYVSSFGFGTPAPVLHVIASLAESMTDHLLSYAPT